MNLSTRNPAEHTPNHEGHGRSLTHEGVEAVRVRYDVRTRGYGNMYKAVALKWPELVETQQPAVTEVVAQHLVANSMTMEDKFAPQATAAPNAVADPITQAQRVLDAAYAQIQSEREHTNA